MTSITQGHENDYEIVIVISITKNCFRFSVTKLVHIYYTVMCNTHTHPSFLFFFYSDTSIAIMRNIIDICLFQIRASSQNNKCETGYSCIGYVL